MASAERNFLLFKTDLFVSEQRDEDIDKWFVGGDSAGWFYARLLSVDGIKRGCEPVMEDWGWTFGMQAHQVRVWVNIWAFDCDGSWVFGIEPKKRFFRGDSPQTLLEAKELVCTAVEKIITADPRFVKHEWFAQHPWEIGRTKF